MAAETKQGRRRKEMSFYDSWLYREVLNTKGFAWAVVWGMFALQALLPIGIWFLFAGKNPLNKLRRFRAGKDRGKAGERP